MKNGPSKLVRKLLLLNLPIWNCNTLDYEKLGKANKKILSDKDNPADRADDSSALTMPSASGVI